MPVETLSSTLMGCCVTPVSEDHGDKYGVPSLEELGETPVVCLFVLDFKKFSHFFVKLTTGLKFSFAMVLIIFPKCNKKFYFVLWKKLDIKWI